MDTQGKILSYAAEKQQYAIEPWGNRDKKVALKPKNLKPLAHTTWSFLHDRWFEKIRPSTTGIQCKVLASLTMPAKDIMYSLIFKAK